MRPARRLRVEGQVVAFYRLEDLAPGRIVVAVRSQTDSRDRY
jgi:hypothetical protein